MASGLRNSIVKIDENQMSHHIHKENMNFLQQNNLVNRINRLFDNCHNTIDEENLPWNLNSFSGMILKYLTRDYGFMEMNVPQLDTMSDWSISSLNLVQIEESRLKRFAGRDEVCRNKLCKPINYKPIRGVFPFEKRDR